MKKVNKVWCECEYSQPEKVGKRVLCEKCSLPICCEICNENESVATHIHVGFAVCEYHFTATQNNVSTINFSALRTFCTVMAEANAEYDEEYRFLREKYNTKVDAATEQYNTACKEMIEEYEVKIRKING